MACLAASAYKIYKHNRQTGERTDARTVIVICLCNVVTRQSLNRVFRSGQRSLGYWVGNFGRVRLGRIADRVPTLSRGEHWPINNDYTNKL